MRIARAAFVVVGAFGVATSAIGHGGGLDKNGCHTNRKTGEYHCHGVPRSATSAPQPLVSAQPPEKCPEVVSEEQLAKTVLNLLKVLGVEVRPSTGSVLSDASLGVQMFEARRGKSSSGDITGDLLLELSSKVANVK